MAYLLDGYLRCVFTVSGKFYLEWRYKDGVFAIGWLAGWSQEPTKPESNPPRSNNTKPSSYLGLF